MATPLPSLTVSPVDAARAAFHHTRSQLFPIRLEKWLVPLFHFERALSLMLLRQMGYDVAARLLP